MTVFIIGVLALNQVAVLALLLTQWPSPLKAIVHNGRKVDGVSILVLRNFLQKQVGLLNHAAPPSDYGIYLARSKVIHTRKMKFPITAIGIARSGIVTAVKTIPPGEPRFAFPRGTTSVLELSHIVADRIGIVAGDQIQLEAPSR